MRNSLSRNTLSLAAYTFAHFCVDFACFYQLFAGLARTSARLDTVATGFLAYNVIAFGLQPFIGYACDRRRTWPIAVIGCLMVLGGLLLLPLAWLSPLPFAWLSPLSLAWLSLVVCALGNACFHVGGGSESLVNAGGKMARSGIFVSSGALGVVLGTLLGKGTGPLPGWPFAPSILAPIMLLALSSAAIRIINPHPTLPLMSDRKSVAKLAPESGTPASAFMAPPFGTASLRHPFTTVMLLCLVSITIRSYVGSIIPIDWRTSTLLVLLPAIGAFGGKAIGGILADWFGARRVGVFSLLAALPLLVFANGSPVPCVLGIVLFNISMSITLCAIADMLPGFPGLSFGLTTLALLTGNLPTFFLAIPRAINSPVIGVLILASAGCLHLAVSNRNRQTQPHMDLNGGESHEQTNHQKAPDAL